MDRGNQVRHPFPLLVEREVRIGRLGRQVEVDGVDTFQGSPKARHVA